MNLIIVESPTKARTLTRFLHGKGDYRIEATMGHIRDLPKATLGVDVDHDFAPTYIIPKDRQRRVGELKDLAKKADRIILATDPDREGEAIAFHAAEILKSKSQIPNPKSKANPKSKNQTIPFSRIVFHEITESAIHEAISHPREIDRMLVDAQQARRVLDRLVGYKLSPLLWQKLSRRWLSAGRVQSAAVRLIVEREREIEKFAKEEFWTVEGTFLCHPGRDPGSIKKTLDSGPLHRSEREESSEAGMTITAQLISKNGVKYEKTLTLTLFDGTYTTANSTIDSKQKAEQIIADCRAPFTVSAVDKKEIRRSAPAPYTTSTLQQDAGRRLGFSAKRTMQLAQKLYEEGIITYHRTDSVNLSEKFLDEARAFIGQTYGADYLPPKARRFQTKSKLAQEAHEAIRPTDVRVQRDQFTRASIDMNRDHIRLYDLIWKRALASQVSDAMFDSTTIRITSANGYLFEAQGSIIKFDGFLKVLERDENGHIVLPEVSVGQKVTLGILTPTPHETSPPPRYTEATLIKAMEEEGIGRPSTYAPILTTIQERLYVEKVDKKLVPTDLGFTVTDFLVQYFPNIVELAFTAQMEDEFDAIALGEKSWQPVIAAFYGPFAKQLGETYETAQKVKIPVEETKEICPNCASPLVIRTGRYGRFIACSTFPACKYSRQLIEKIDIPCPKCGGDIIIKKSRKRAKVFYGCANWPTCTFAAWKKEDIK
ncbi:type I DNA topoisomerase [Candidatus Gottesmanbacteria bacterium]|nr:type I DNA topoisomerase [Candidatus Gottesmanbacteria bacterium]